MAIAVSKEYQCDHDMGGKMHISLSTWYPEALWLWFSQEDHIYIDLGKNAAKQGKARNRMMACGVSWKEHCGKEANMKQNIRIEIAITIQPRNQRILPGGDFDSEAAMQHMYI